MKVKVLLALSIVTISTSLFAQPKPEDQIQYRQSGMNFMRWNIGKIKSQVVDNPQAYDKEQVIAAANVIAAIANSGLGELFGPQTETGKGWKETRVKQEYFEEPDEVKMYAAAFRRDANELASVAYSGDVTMIKAQFENLFESCRSCHKKFRAKN